MPVRVKIDGAGRRRVVCCENGELPFSEGPALTVQDGSYHSCLLLDSRRHFGSPWGGTAECIHLQIRGFLSQLVDGVMMYGDAVGSGLLFVLSTASAQWLRV